MDPLRFTGEDADRIFNELKDLEVDLDQDPLVYGPKRLNQKVSEIKCALGRCERLFLDMSQRHHTVRQLLSIAEVDLELAKQHLFANDPETRAGRSVSDREAIAAGKLKEDVLAQRDLNMALQSLDAVLVVIRAKRSDLRDTQSRLRDQIRLCQEEIGLGSCWGSRVPNAPALKPVAVSKSSLAAIEDLVGRIDGEIHLGPAVEEDEGTPIEAPPPPKVVEVNVVDESLSGILEESPKVTTLGGVTEAKAIPTDNAPAADVEAFMDALADDPYANKAKKAQDPLEDTLSSLLESFEEIK